jgi:hypothetical protein
MWTSFSYCFIYNFKEFLMNTYHITPLKDLMVHHESINCPCNPVRDSECPNVIVHNAFDGRDFVEDATMQSQAHRTNRQ